MVGDSESNWVWKEAPRESEQGKHGTGNRERPEYWRGDSSDPESDDTVSPGRGGLLLDTRRAFLTRNSSNRQRPVRTSMLFESESPQQTRNKEYLMLTGGPLSTTVGRANCIIQYCDSTVLMVDVCQRRENAKCAHGHGQFGFIAVLHWQADTVQPLLVCERVDDE